jgi:hypothetical protein
LIDDLLTANRTAPEIQEYRQRVSEDQPKWTESNGLILYNGRLIVPETGFLRTRIIQEAHSTALTAHPGKNKTRKIVSQRYWWPKMTDNIDRFVANCEMCRRTTIPRDKPPGLLQPLPIPERPWQHLSMDFKSFPTDRYGYNMIFVTVDRLSKTSVSVPCKDTINAPELARIFIDRIWRFYGPPDTIVSDRGPQFISAFWTEFNRILGTKLKLSTAAYP